MPKHKHSNTEAWIQSHAGMTMEASPDGTIKIQKNIPQSSKDQTTSDSVQASDPGPGQQIQKPVGMGPPVGLAEAG